MKVQVVKIEGEPFVGISEFCRPADASHLLLETTRSVLLSVCDWAKLVEKRDIFEAILSTPQKLKKSTFLITNRVIVEINSTDFQDERTHGHYLHYVKIGVQCAFYQDKQHAVVLNVGKWRELMRESEKAIPGAIDSILRSAEAKEKADKLTLLESESGPKKDLQNELKSAINDESLKGMVASLVDSDGGNMDLKEIDNGEAESEDAESKDAEAEDAVAEDAGAADAE
jgi:hypothetical protein